MGPQHPRAGKSHNRTDLLAEKRGVAVDPAIAAGRFTFLKRAVCQAFAGVVDQIAAVAAERILWSLVMGPAVDIDHSCDCGQFEGQARA